MGLQSVSQPIGEIINLKRTSLNVPGQGGSPLTWTELRPKGDTNQSWWRSCCSNDMQVVYASITNERYLQRSIDGGANWNQDIGASVYSCYAVACNDDGSRAVAADGLFYGLGGNVYHTSNTGTNWNGLAYDRFFYRVAVDEHGTNARIVSPHIAEYDTETVSTYNWWGTFTSGPLKNIAGVSISHDGSVTCWGVGAYPGTTYTGGLITPGAVSPEGAADYQCVSIDATCAVIIAAVYGGGVWKSTDQGASWTEIFPTGVDENKNWLALAVSPDGNHILAGVSGGPIYHSGNGGTTFYQISSLAANDIQFNKNGTAAMVATSTRLYMLTGFATWGGGMSVSQPIGDIIRFRQDTDAYGSNWYIDGVLWTGAIKTVGPGKDYETVVEAGGFDSITEDALYLVDPGTYTAATGIGAGGYYGYKTYWRGLGATCDDTKVGMLQSYAGVINGSILVENMQLSQGPDIGVSFLDTSLSSVFVNKCSFPQVGPYNYIFFRSNHGVWSPDLTMQNCSNIAGQYALCFSINITNVSLIKCLFPTDTKSFVWGSYHTDDHVTVPTSGYGPDYGSFRITQGPIATQPKTIAQLIGQTGIRLRRNFSNVPGE